MSPRKKSKGRFARVYAGDLLALMQTNRSAIAVWLSLDMHGLGRLAYQSVATIERETGLNRRTVQRALEDLVELGLIVPRGEGKGRTNRYQVVHKGEVQECSFEEPQQVENIEKTPRKRAVPAPPPGAVPTPPPNVAKIGEISSKIAATIKSFPQLVVQPEEGGAVYRPRGGRSTDRPQVPTGAVYRPPKENEERSLREAPAHAILDGRVSGALEEKHSKEAQVAGVRRVRAALAVRTRSSRRNADDEEGGST